MRISVVIPTYNRLPALIRAIDSVIGQTSPVDEIIVVDDGSDDGTEILIREKFPQVKFFYQTNQGVSAARNFGIKQAQHPWIALLDSDDSWLADKVETMREAQRTNPEYFVFHSDEIWIRNGVRVNPMNKHEKSGGWIFQKCLPLCVISPSAVVIKRELFDSNGYFDESLPACEDYDLWLRICHQHPVYYIDNPLITKYGGHSDQLSNHYWGMDRFRIRALQNLLNNVELDEENRLATEKILQKKLNILLKGAHKHDNQSVIDEFSPLLQYYQPA
ncbi:MAG: glycosyltransferase family 2 protein [Gammaproteobacteria bacterium]|nr:glycosyltransferase family 2 protein [Gammaproteobacteria bacterium]